MKVTLYIAPNTIKPNFHPHTVLFTNKLSTQVLEHVSTNGGWRYEKVDSDRL